MKTLSQVDVWQETIDSRFVAHLLFDPDLGNF